MENELTPELIAKAKQAKSPGELLALAKENGMEFTEEDAKAYFEQFHKSGELSDEELDNVAGGGCYKGDRLVVSALYNCSYWTCEKCGCGRLENGVKTTGCSGKNSHDSAYCCNCKYCSRESGLWLCNNPKKMK